MAQQGRPATVRASSAAARSSPPSASGSGGQCTADRRQTSRQRWKCWGEHSNADAAGFQLCFQSFVGSIIDLFKGGGESKGAWRPKIKAKERRICLHIDYPVYPRRVRDMAIFFALYLFGDIRGPEMKPLKCPIQQYFDFSTTPEIRPICTSEQRFRLSVPPSPFLGQKN